MVRGAAKEQAREKAQKKTAAHAGGASQLKARAAGLQFICPTCRSQVGSYKLLAQHMESKHPGTNIPTEESFQK
ncbi:putative zinc finger protein [Chytriomyces cf. hyalinus JEL632]|nr:putative zinc finger protein [Chytriomyces cf. hyalinus JEL632]